MGKIVRFLTAGESHGECLMGIIEGLPYGYELDFDFINQELAFRQSGKGRGGRMLIEKDKIDVKSGVRFGVTTASPLSFEIKNNDWKNWLIPMSVTKVDLSDPEVKALVDEKSITKLRPAHADLSAHLKYGFCDIRNSLERSSARETATRVAVGAICQNILKNYDIEFSSEVLSIGECTNSKDFDNYIEKIQKEGNSIGGLIKITIKNVPSGLGSFTHWDRKLDGLLSQAIVSIPAVKSVEFGLGKDYSKIDGYSSHDEIYFENGKYYHKTNNSGGIEGGMSTGEDIVITLAMKPIPTMKKALQSVDIKSKASVEAHFERADSCAVEACSIVARNMCAIVILDAFLEKFGPDCKQDIDVSYKNYLDRLSE